MVPPTHREAHIPSSEILQCAARLLLPPKSREKQDGENRGNPGTKILLLDLDKVIKIWRAVALVIDNSLLSVGRGIRIESLGTFTLDAKGRAHFFLASEFASRHRLLKHETCAGACMAGGSVNTRLNIARVAATAGSSRPDAERVVNAVLRSLRQRLAAGKPVILSFHPVAMFSCVPGEQVDMRYLPGFRARQKAARLAATRVGISVGQANTKASPWATPLSATTTAAAKVAVDSNSGTTTTVTVPSMENPGSTRRSVVGSTGMEQRPRSASDVLSAADHITRNRPETSHGNGSVAPVKKSLAINSPQAACVAIDPAQGLRTCEGPASGIDYHCGDDGRIPADPSSSGTSPRPPAYHGPLEGHGGHSNCGHSDKHFVEKMGFSGAFNCGHRGSTMGLKKHPELDEKWLAALLCRKTFVHAGTDGVRRLRGTLRLMYMGPRSGDGRLSGSDLLQALRDVGTALTSDELTEVASVFKRQPDRCVSLQAILAEMERKVWSSVSGGGATRPPSGRVPLREDNSLLSKPRCRSPQSRDGNVSVKSCKRGSLTPSSGGKRGRGGGGDGDIAGTLSCDEQKASKGPVDMPCTTAEDGKRQYQCENGKPRARGGCQRMGRSHHGGSNSCVRKKGAALDKARVTQGAAPFMQQARLECWRDNGSGDSPGVAAGSDAVADMAKILYNPPCSLEGLIHLLQASKVTEQPTVAPAALSVRLTQLRPGLGKEKAKQLAAAACRHPDTQIDLGQLHALLERRFGHSKSGNFSVGTASSSTVSATTTILPGTGTSCAALARVRRQLLAGEKGFERLKAALSAGSGFGDGTLTKDELRRALIMASGQGSLPPTSKDVDDLFTLFSCQTTGGVGGSRVAATTVLRGLRGELSPYRDNVVRDVYRGLLALGGDTTTVKNLIRDSLGAFGGGGSGPRSGQNERVTKDTINDVVQLDQIERACCSTQTKEGLRRTSGGIGRRGHGGTVGLGGWCSVQAEADSDTPRSSLAGADKQKNTTREKKGVTAEQFLEYYRGVSAGIDGDDAFEAVVRGTWSLLPQAQSTKSSISTVGKQRRQSNGVSEGVALDDPPYPFHTVKTPAPGRRDDKPGTMSPLEDAAPVSYGDETVADRHFGGKTREATNTTAAAGAVAAEAVAAGQTVDALPSKTTVDPITTCSAAEVATSGSGQIRPSENPQERRSSRKEPTNEKRTRVVRSKNGNKASHPCTTTFIRSGRKQGKTGEDPLRVASSLSQRRRQVATDHNGRRRRLAASGPPARRGKEEEGIAVVSSRGRQNPTEQREQQQNQHRRRPGGLKNQRMDKVNLNRQQHQQQKPQQQQRQETNGSRVIKTPHVAATDLSWHQDHQHTKVTPAKQSNVDDAPLNQPAREQHVENMRTSPRTSVKGKTESINKHGLGSASKRIKFSKSDAAVLVQRVFRGHKGRECAASEGRKRARRWAAQREEQAERERPSAASRRLAGRLSRPKLPGTYGF